MQTFSKPHICYFVLVNDITFFSIHIFCTSSVKAVRQYVVFFRNSTFNVCYIFQRTDISIVFGFHLFVCLLLAAGLLPVAFPTAIPIELCLPASRVPGLP